MHKDEAIRRKLVELQSESEKLDRQIADLADAGSFDQLRLRRLRRRRQALADEINRLGDSLTPDIIA